MTGVELLSELQARGIEVQADGDRLRLRPPEALDSELLGALRQHKVEVLAVLASKPDWPVASLEAERRFVQPHAKFFPFIGRKVRTPGGPGTLVEVSRDRVTVVLDSELSRCSFFTPDQIEPVSWELA